MNFYESILVLCIGGIGGYLAMRIENLDKRLDALSVRIERLIVNIPKRRDDV